MSLFQEVDMCVSTVAPLYVKRPIMDFSQPVDFVEAGIIIPFPAENPKIWVDASVFLTDVSILKFQNLCYAFIILSHTLQRLG